MIEIAQLEQAMQRGLGGFPHERLHQEAIALTLNARLTAVGFYQKLGFKTVGEAFLSSITGIPHIKMNQKLRFH